MKIRIRRIDKSIALPEYKTAGSAGFDLSSRDEVTIPPGGTKFVPLNIIVELPKTHMLLLAARSSLPKKGLMLANGVGIGDSDFCGPDDEYQAMVYNFSDKAVIIEKGERIGQGIIVNVDRAEFEEADHVDHPSRGGFGSTGQF
ncbi:MAG: dUTPase [Candidatus Terrybacteria bacterium RIFCSPHIGHO2_01_FULL_48_17]|uniref:dUTP diphosphatase n=1 Tax=Candidatus Terrybacteria bacterium RIFCSPHIGHO2_01_FULL_48_17 TaxID=1802362 RepID=A0A1G2PJI3_9BACT|nr:MAG: dUTPase [Candidatus Terrybacteria bacterium RIFCSPHIGHO2_01_FULL_48_17]OHA53182.1 MAG: dUTPase [Candidatus Terrybacteria bacterium RIFCSPLOWO2_01_FULL_48_14]